VIKFYRSHRFHRSQKLKCRVLNICKGSENETWQSGNELDRLEEVVPRIDDPVNEMLRPGRLDSGPEEGASGREIGIAERAGRHELGHEVPKQFFELGSSVEALPSLLEVGLELDLFVIKKKIILNLRCI
jgi:hypothetical protein